MRYGFAIDQRTCIGCHACTVACKTEHDIPVGQFRTWVKYVDSGEFPNNTRDFGVMRCNHCTDAPCVRICPTSALFTRDDGIVDFDSSRCIGCKSCMQACPYDAIYIDEDTHTAAKCNFCAHRVDAGYEPACVVVCPTHSIWVGDLADPESGIATLVRDNPVSVRAPEQNTGPNVFYLGADRAVLDPLAAPTGSSYLYSRPDPHRAGVGAELSIDPATGAVTTLNTAHPRPWGWRVTTYLWTKGVGAGALLIAALAWFLGVDLGWVGAILAPALAVAGAGVTGALLVVDLKRPERWYFLFTKPNPRSWLVLGALVLLGFGAVGGLWLLAGVSQATGLLDTPGWLTALLAVLAVPASLLAAGYTAFLFGQAEGRDLWQSPLLFWHLQVQALMVGAGALAVAGWGLTGTPIALLAWTLALAAAANVLLILLEYLGGHASAQAFAAARLASRGTYRRQFWAGGIGLAALAGLLAAPTLLADAPNATMPLLAAAGLLAQPALLCYESVFVRAGQDPPLS